MDHTSGEALVSIVVPVYNVAVYLEDCLLSIREQTYRHLQVIIVDDGSTDGSGEMCDAFAADDPRFSVVHTANSGLSAARNEGMRHVDGDYVVFVDSDDYLGPSHVANRYNAIMVADDPSAAMAVTGFVEVGANAEYGKDMQA